MPQPLSLSARAIVLVAAIFAASTGCASQSLNPMSTPMATATVATAAPSTVSCVTLAGQLTVAEQAGQLLMMGITNGYDASEASIRARNKVGAVIFLGKSPEGVTGVRQITDRIAAADSSIGLLVAADQEGGKIQRLTGPGFGTMPSAAQQAKMTDADLTAAAGSWALALRNAGVHVNLAPVADVVPIDAAATNEPVAKLQRGYGSDSAIVGRKVTAFIAGMRTQGIGTSLKHFPGLGQVQGNTDFTADVVDTATTRRDATLASFRAGIAAGADSVMISTATYTRIDPQNQAVFSATVMDMLRSDLAFTGVIISDDLGGAVSIATVPAGERATRFVAAGGDLVINADPRTIATMADALIRAASADPAMATRITSAAAHVLAWKSKLGLVQCSPS